MGLEWIIPPVIVWFRPVRGSGPDNPAPSFTFKGHSIALTTSAILFFDRFLVFDSFQSLILMNNRIHKRSHQACENCRCVNPAMLATIEAIMTNIQKAQKDEMSRGAPSMLHLYAFTADVSV